MNIKVKLTTKTSGSVVRQSCSMKHNQTTVDNDNKQVLTVTSSAYTTVEI